ncbi:MAG: hypothetical protein V4534_04210 [Myxococcota bacterium]
MLKTILSSLLITGAAFAAVPPMNENMRASFANSIFEGKVLKIETESVGSMRDEEFEDTHYYAKIQVTKVVKTDLVGRDMPKEVTATYWKVAQRPRGWTGSQGQNSKMKVGDKVRIYANRDDKMVFHVLQPNGWVDLSVSDL